MNKQRDARDIASSAVASFIARLTDMRARLLCGLDERQSALRSDAQMQNAHHAKSQRVFLECSHIRQLG
ncbi:MAG: hypothetical protein AB8H80_20125 [Planctomycetota bacterium]